MLRGVLVLVAAVVTAFALADLDRWNGLDLLALILWALAITALYRKTNQP